MYLSLQTLTSIIITCSPILVELTDQTNSVIICLFQMTSTEVNLPTRIPDCHSHSAALLYLFISSDASICSAVAFTPLRNCNHVAVTISIEFP